MRATELGALLTDSSAGEVGYIAASIKTVGETTRRRYRNVR